MALVEEQPRREEGKPERDEMCGPMQKLTSGGGREEHVGNLSAPGKEAGGLLRVPGRSWIRS